jgi:hypothetical protein
MPAGSAKKAAADFIIIDVSKLPVERRTLSSVALDLDFFDFDLAFASVERALLPAALILHGSAAFTKMTTETNSPRTRSDALYYALAVAFGIATGAIDLAVNDLLFTALLVLMLCMILGALRPRWPWRWAVVMSATIPLSEQAAYLIRTVKPTHPQVYGSFLTLLPGIAGVYGGAVVRGVVNNLRQGK